MEISYFTSKKAVGILGLFWCCFKLLLEKETLFTYIEFFLIRDCYGPVISLWTLTEIVMVDPPLTITLTNPRIMESVL